MLHAKHLNLPSHNLSTPLKTLVPLCPYQGWVTSQLPNGATGGLSSSQDVNKGSGEREKQIPKVTKSVSVITDTVVLGVTFWNTFYILRMDNTVRSTANLTEKLAYNGNIDHHWYVVLLLTDLLYRRDTIRVRCVYIFRGTFVYWEYEYRILLALNILMMVLDILSIAGDGVSTLDGAGYPASDMSIAWQPITIRPSRRCVGLTSNLCLVLLT